MNRLASLYQALCDRGYGCSVRVDEPLAPYSSFKIGGPADLLAVARTWDCLRDGVHLAWVMGMPVRVLGSGTNVLIADRGIRGLVILNQCSGYAVDERGLVIAQSGTRLCEIAQETIAQGWAGLEWAVGVPGTVGGAVVGNAGAYGGCMADHVRWVNVLLPDGTSECLSVDALQYEYRNSLLKREACPRHRRVVLEAALQLAPGNAEELLHKAGANTMQRELRTPEGSCAGSVFKRTAHYPPGFLIEQAGLKGRRIGGAEVSTKHANFIMNVGGASAGDVKALIDLVQEEVWRSFGCRLEPEIELIGDWVPQPSPQSS